VRDSIIFWFSMMKEIYQDLKNGVEVEQISLNFHYTLVQIIKSISCQKDSIALSGGCFQNAILTQLVVESLRDKKVFLNHEIPCNDGGISFGQAYFMQLLEKKH
ncbi:MAG: carbamoyltransferase HypF, partial [Helicobacter sp.]|nr:carbamoyltransferase HypF [Helicobacter sp.]